MTTLSRREREFAARERCILDHARELVREVGFLNLQMAELARRAEYATGTLYHHFRCKEDILFRLASEGIELRSQFFERVARWDACSRDRMAGMGYADWLLVNAHPDHFRIEQLAKAVDIWDRATPEVREAMMNKGEGCGNAILSVVSDAISEGDLAPGTRSPQQVSFSFWTMSSGTHTVTHAAGILERFEMRDPYVILARNYQVMLNGLRWKPLQDAEDDTALYAFFDRLHAEVFPDHQPAHRSHRDDSGDTR